MMASNEKEVIDTIGKNTIPWSELDVQSNLKKLPINPNLGGES